MGSLLMVTRCSLVMGKREGGCVERLEFPMLLSYFALLSSAKYESNIGKFLAPCSVIWEHESDPCSNHTC